MVLVIKKLILKMYYKMESNELKKKLILKIAHVIILMI